MSETERGRFTRRRFGKTAIHLSAGAAAWASQMQRAATFGATKPGDAKTYRSAVIGHTGRGNYGHGMEKIWRDTANAKLVAIADADEAGRTKKTEELDVDGFADYRELLSKVKPELVAVAPRWLDQHRDMVIASANAGAKGIYLEKPMCQTLEQADEMVRACEANGTKLAMATQNRYSPQVKIISKMIANDDLGEIVEIRARGKDDRRGGGEDLWVLGTHMLDLMSLFGGGATSCFAQVFEDGALASAKHVKDGAEGIGPLMGDEIHAMFRLGIGANGYWDSKRNTGGKPSRFGIRIQGTKGVVELYDVSSLPYAIFLPASSWSSGRSGTNWKRINSGGIDVPETITSAGLHEGNVFAIKDLINSVEKDRQPVANIYEARKTVEMIASVFDSHRLGRTVQLPLENRKNPLRLL